MERPEDLSIVFLTVSDKISCEAGRSYPQQLEEKKMKDNENILQKKVISQMLVGIQLCLA